jgi:hypothetical protein
MGVSIASSNGASDLFSCCGTELLAYFLIEQFRLLLENNSFPFRGIQYGFDLRDIYYNLIPEGEDYTEDEIAKITVDHYEIEYYLNKFRQEHEDRNYSYNLKEVLVVLDSISPIIYASRLSGLFTSIRFAKEDRPYFSHYESMELADTLRILKSLSSPQSIDYDLYDRFGNVFEDALTTPNGFVSFG